MSCTEERKDEFINVCLVRKERSKDRVPVPLYTTCRYRNVTTV